MDFGLLPRPPQKVLVYLIFPQRESFSIPYHSLARKFNIPYHSPAKKFIKISVDLIRFEISQLSD